MIDTVVETLYMYYVCGIRFGLVRCCICNNMDVKKNKKKINVFQELRHRVGSLAGTNILVKRAMSVHTVNVYACCFITVW